MEIYRLEPGVRGRYISAEKVPLATLEDCDKIVARSSFQNREILGFNGSRCDLLKHGSPRCLRGKQARPIRDEKRRICVV